MSEIPSQNKVNVGLKFATTDLDKQVDTALLKQLVDGHLKRGGRGGGGNPGLENPMVDPFLQLNTKHSSVELSW